MIIREITVQLVEVEHEHVVLHVAAYPWQIHFGPTRNSDLFDVLFRTDAAVHQQNRRVVRSGRKDHFFPRLENLGGTLRSWRRREVWVCCRRDEGGSFDPGGDICLVRRRWLAVLIEGRERLENHSRDGGIV